MAKKSKATQKKKGKKKAFRHLKPLLIVQKNIILTDLLGCFSEQTGAQFG